MNLADPAHAALTMLLGHQAKREVLRARFRTLAAMQVQVREQGRHLGGRPPYGYRLVDGGPHPNAAHARWGRRLHRLDPDPATAPHVQRIFAHRLAGHSTASIARALNDHGVPCPSSSDPERNTHRTGEAWTLRTVAEILANPRYTGRQVWNRQCTDHEPAGHASPSQPRRAKTRRNPQSEWIVSRHRAHPALVSEREFVAAQQISATLAPADGRHRSYQLTGLVRCGMCGRRMVAHWVHGRPGYRCRHGQTSASPRRADRPKRLYVREDRLLIALAEQLSDQVAGGDVAAHLRAAGIAVVWNAAGHALQTQHDGHSRTSRGRRGV